MNQLSSKRLWLLKHKLNLLIGKGWRCWENCYRQKMQLAHPCDRFILWASPSTAQLSVLFIYRYFLFCHCSVVSKCIILSPARVFNFFQHVNHIFRKWLSDGCFSYLWSITALGQQVSYRDKEVNQAHMQLRYTCFFLIEPVGHTVWFCSLFNLSLLSVLFPPLSLLPISWICTI